MVDPLRRSCLFALLSWQSISRAEQLPALIARSRRSIVAVGAYSALRSPRFTFSGTGFVLGDGTVVATCLHVLPDIPPTLERVELVIQLTGDRGELEWRGAKVLVRDRSKDLCLLRVEGAPLAAMQLTERAEIDAAEGAQVALMGFPIGGALGFSVVTHRGIVSSHVTSTSPAPSAGSLSDRAALGARTGGFDLLQLDATAYPGNSGGPLINMDNGSVVGVVSMVLVKGTRESALSSPTGITYAVPSKYIAALLKQF